MNTFMIVSSALIAIISCVTGEQEGFYLSLSVTAHFIVLSELEQIKKTLDKTK